MSQLWVGSQLTHVDQVAAALEGFFWPKIFWDFLSKDLDWAVKPFPFLQILNLALGISIICLELPLRSLVGTALHQSIKARLFILPLSTLAAACLYQATDPAIYYMIGTSVYLWAYVDNEVRNLRATEREGLTGARAGNCAARHRG